MDITELDELEASVSDLLSMAKVEIEQKRIQEQRNEQIEQIVAQIEERLQPLLAQIEKMLAEFDGEGIQDSSVRQKLEDKAADLRKELAEAPALAAQEADRQMLLHEERLLEERLQDQTNQWRYELKADLLEMINEQQDFYSATDASIAVRSEVNELKAIGALDEVVEALINQINAYSEEGPVAKLRGSHEQTLNFIYQKALTNRSRVERSPDVQPSTKHRKSEKRPSLYGDLEGKVVVFGGHDRLQTAVKNRLRDASVDLVWCTEQGGLQMAGQSENHINNADLVIVVTGYASHSLTEKALEACRRIGRSPEILNTTGMTRVLEAIESGLKAQLLARHWNQS
ncbi:hypothetical protein Pse7367_0397 [Thalassoporum mexicanum PCC 7367]|uniref:DUF2325 domain-containing protein n=1 Tax=Thalassoporum mexicanum TaxID=3457544 RepID=UPI00029F9A3F|nr:DUF2325 domain-containing protein [Pseudanabaena sp. PCC 7367]AFY68708.1 hypothetical protein Pse7367_0397 [Pseudanabaena sp. PCC 7367]